MQVCVNGRRRTKTLPTKAEATAWASQQEAELSGRQLPNKTLADAFERYAEKVSPTKDGARWEILRLKALARFDIACERLSAITTSDIADWRDERLKAVTASTVYREMTLIRSVLESARKEWGWLNQNPMQGIGWPKTPPSRKRRVTDDEIERLMFAFGLDEGLVADTAMNRVGLSFLFALETGMRAGEITGLRRKDVHAKHVHLPKTKNGDERDVPLSVRAREILSLLDGDPVFGLDGRSRDVMFRRARDRCQIPDLHFHDSRSEAIWRLSKKLDVLELARVVGHRDIRSLMMYYQTSAADLADRL